MWHIAIFSEVKERGRIKWRKESWKLLSYCEQKEWKDFFFVLCFVLVIADYILLYFRKWVWSLINSYNNGTWKTFFVYRKGRLINVVTLVWNGARVETRNYLRMELNSLIDLKQCRRDFLRRSKLLFYTNFNLNNKHLD